LENAIEAVSRRYEGFYFGRYDVRSDSVEAFQAGRFKVLELNGLTSEATHIYQPGTSLVQAYRVLARQWAHAFAIAVENRRRGAPGATWSSILEAWRRTRHHP
jgi:hypothetical protein